MNDIAEGAVGEELAEVEDDGERAVAGGGLGVAGDEVFEAGFTAAGVGGDGLIAPVVAVRLEVAGFD